MPFDPLSAQSAFTRAMSLIARSRTNASLKMSGVFDRSPVNQSGPTNLHGGIGRNNQLTQIATATGGGNLSLDILLQQARTTQSSLDKGPLSDNVDISSGTGSFAMAPAGEKTTVQQIKDGGSNVAFADGMGKVTLGQANTNTNLTTPNTSGNNATVNNTATVQVAQVGVNLDNDNKVAVTDSGMVHAEQTLIGKPNTPTANKPDNLAEFSGNQAVTVQQKTADASSTVVATNNVLVSSTQQAVATNPASPVGTAAVMEGNLTATSDQTVRNGDAGVALVNNAQAISTQVVQNGASNTLLVSGAVSANATQFSDNVTVTQAQVDNVSDLTLTQGGSNTTASATISNVTGLATVLQGVNNDGTTQAATTATVSERLGVPNTPGPITPTPVTPTPNLTDTVSVALNTTGSVNVLQQQTLAGDATALSSNAVGNVGIVQTADRSGAQVASVDGQLGGNVIIGQGSQGSGEQGAVVSNSVGSSIVVGQVNQGSGDSTIAATGNAAQGIAIGQLNQPSTAAPNTLTPNTLTAQVEGNTVINPDGSLGSIAVIQGSQRATATVGTEATGNFANTTIRQSTTADTGINGILVSGNVGDVNTSQTAFGADPNAPISAKTGSSVSGTLGNTVQGAVKQNTSGSTTLLNDGTLGAVSLFDVQQNTTGNTTLNVSNAINLSGQPTVAGAHVVSPETATTAIGDVAVASQTVGATGTQSINLDSNAGNQTVSTERLNSGEQAITVTNASNGIVTVASTAASTPGTNAATSTTTVDEVINGQVAVNNTNTHQGAVTQTVSHVVATSGTPDVVAASGNLVAVGDVAVLGNKTAGIGAVTQVVTGVTGDVAATASNILSGTDATGSAGTSQTIANVDGSVATFAQNIGTAGGSDVTVSGVSGTVDIKATNLMSAGPTTINASEVGAINIESVSDSGQTITASEAATINVATVGNTTATISHTGVATLAAAGNQVNLGVNNVGTANVALAAGQTTTTVDEAGTANLIGVVGSGSVSVTNTDTINAALATQDADITLLGNTVNATVITNGTGDTTITGATTNAVVTQLENAGNNVISVDATGGGVDKVVYQDQSGAVQTVTVKASSGSAIDIGRTNDKVNIINDGTGTDAVYVDYEGNVLSPEWTSSGNVIWRQKAPAALTEQSIIPAAPIILPLTALAYPAAVTVAAQ